MNKGMKMFENYLAAQKELAENWQEMSKEGLEQMTKNMEEAGFDFGPEEYFQKTMEWTQDNYDIFTDPYSGKPQELFGKLSQAQSAYQDLFNVWTEINKDKFEPAMEASREMYEEWAENFAEQMDSNYLSYMPGPVKNMVEDSVALLESYRTATSNYWQPWMESEEDLNDIFIKSMTADPKAYLEYLQVWKENYDRYFSKMINTPAMGINRELFEKQSDNFDKFIRFSILVQEITAHINQIGQETMVKVIENYFETMEKGTEIKSFEEFYKYWSEEIGDALDVLYFSDEFSELTAETLKAMAELKIESDKLWETYLSNYPIPKNSDMNSLYKTVHDLKREVKSLRKELNTINKSEDKKEIAKAEDKKAPATKKDEPKNKTKK